MVTVISGECSAENRNRRGRTSGNGKGVRQALRGRRDGRALRKQCDQIFPKFRIFVQLFTLGHFGVLHTSFLGANPTTLEFTATYNTSVVPSRLHRAFFKVHRTFFVFKKR
jgi:hypothetical protein